MLSSPRVDPGALIAAIPALLHFSPMESIVLIGVTEAPPRVMVRCVMRVDLPHDGKHVDDLAQQLTTAVIAQELAAVALVIVAAGDPSEAEPSHRAVRDGLLRSLADAGVEVIEALWTPHIERGRPWRSSLYPERTGTLPDPGRSPVAVDVVLDGVPIYATREDLVAQLAPHPDPVLGQRVAQLRALPAVEPTAGAQLLRQLVQRIGAADPTAEAVLDEDTLVRAAHVLTHPQVRDASLAFALTEQAGAAERLWTMLTRAIPAPVVAHPASLLASVLYLRGDGVLAQVALGIALTADPHHPLAETLRMSLDLAVPPHRFRQFLVASFEAVAGDDVSSVVDPPR